MKVQGALSRLRFDLLLCVDMLSRGLCMRNGVLGVPGADRSRVTVLGADHSFLALNIVMGPLNLKIKFNSYLYT